MTEHRKFCRECFEMVFECECIRSDPEIDEPEPEAEVEPKAEVKMHDNAECPICMDALDSSKNFAATECGHNFHLSCLMKNVSHNGFGCPYCRTKMTDEPEHDADDESVWTEDSEAEEEIFDDSALNGFRWLMMRTEGEEIPEDDVEEEEEEEEQEEQRPRPSIELIIQKLSEKRITMEHAVKALLTQHEEFADDREIQNTDDRLYGEVRRIIMSFTPEQVSN